MTDPRGIPDRATQPERWGVWVESACLASAWNAGQRVSYWREEPFEVDGVSEGSWGSWAIEVKTGWVTSGELRGLGEFVRRHPSFRPLVVCDDEARTAADRAGFEAVGWQEFLLQGPPGAAPAGAEPRAPGSERARRPSPAPRAAPRTGVPRRRRPA